MALGASSEFRSGTGVCGGGGIAGTLALTMEMDASKVASVGKVEGLDMIEDVKTTRKAVEDESCS